MTGEQVLAIGSRRWGGACRASLVARAVAIASWLALAGGVSAASGEEPLSLTISPGGPEIRSGDELWARLRIDDGPKPYIWPLLGPGGMKLTRSYPMEKVPGEQYDHPHQRSLWFTHGDVNGVDFWTEGQGHGKIVHRDFSTIDAGGESITLVSENDWLAPDGKRLCADRRRITFRATPEARIVDFEIALLATDGDVRFGDTKEGTFGVRVSSQLVLAKHGRITTSEGLTDRDAWGKQAAWVDYSGTVDDRPGGVAIFNHPSSFRFPTYWHVRDYGLFAANPFGWHDFQGNDQVDGSHVIPAGERIVLRYRVLLHGGDAEAAKVAEEFAAYARETAQDL